MALDVHSKNFVDLVFGTYGYDKSVRQLSRFGATLSTVQTQSVKVGGKLYKVTRKLGYGNELLGKSIQQTTQQQNDFTLAMRRALIVAPVWMAARGAMMAVLGAMKDIVATYKELDEGMKRVMAVATYTAKTQSKIYGELQQAAKAYFATSTAGMKDITESMYQLGTAGLSTEQIMEGFEHVMNLSIGTYSNVTSAGRLMAGVFNVFGDELKRVGDTAEQMEYVADLMATAWRNNQIELNEINTAMGYLASSGKIVGLGLEELVATAAVLSDAMLRTGKGARYLSRAFIQISQKGERLRELGVIFDPTKPLDFYDVMTQLNNIYLEQGKSLEFLNKMHDIWGRLGIRAVGGIVEMWGKYNEEVTRTPDKMKEASKEIAKIAQLSRMDLTKRIWHKVITGVGAPEKTQIRKEIEKMVAQDDTRIKQMNKINKLIEKYGDALKITKEELKGINRESKQMSQIRWIRLLKATTLWGVALEGVNKVNQLSAEEIEKLYTKIVGHAKELAVIQAEEPDWEAMTDAVMEKAEIEDAALKKTKEDLEYKLMILQGVSKTAVTMEKINKLLKTRNNDAKYLGKTEATIGDVLSLNKEALQGTVHLEKLLKLGAKGRLDAETDRQKIIQMSINAQLDELKAQGATLEQRIQAKILFEDSLGKQRGIVEATKNELDLRKAINAQKEVDIRLSAQTMKLAQIAEERGVDVAKELGELLQGRVKWAEFEAEAMNETWDALVKFFPQILKQQRAMQLLITGAEPYVGRRFEAAREIPIKEEYLRAPLEQNKLMVKALESQMATKEKELQKQIEVLEKQKEIKEELTKQTEILKEIDRKKVSTAVQLYFKNKPVSKEELIEEIRTDGTPTANALDDRNEKF